jgi:hypothetical protein
MGGGGGGGIVDDGVVDERVLRGEVRASKSVAGAEERPVSTPGEHLVTDSVLEKVSGTSANRGDADVNETCRLMFCASFRRDWGPTTE